MKKEVVQRVIAIASIILGSLFLLLSVIDFIKLVKKVRNIEDKIEVLGKISVPYKINSVENLPPKDTIVVYEQKELILHLLTQHQNLANAVISKHPDLVNNAQKNGKQQK